MPSNPNWILTALCATAMVACSSGGHSNPVNPDDAAQTAREAFAERTDTASPPPAPATLLHAYHWDLARITGTDEAWFSADHAALREPLRLGFDDQRIGVSGLCNRIGAGYTLDGARIAITMPISTKMACIDDRLMRLETQVANQLTEAREWQIDTAPHAPRLQLHFANGSTWVFDGTPTDTTRYGSAPEQLFLEIAPQTRPCQLDGQPHQCLEVRRIAFDANGLRTSAGPWEVYEGRIEGYVHEPGMRKVLRINRYTPASSGATNGAFVDVLDMTVSTEIAR